jgi:hypothetical protein
LAKADAGRSKGVSGIRGQQERSTNRVNKEKKLPVISWAGFECGPAFLKKLPAR